MNLLILKKIAVQKEKVLVEKENLILKKDPAEKDDDENIGLVRNRKSGAKKNKEEDIEQPVSESSEIFQIDRLLQNFDQKEFLPPPKFKDTMHIKLLDFKANFPMYTTIFIIYGIGFVYFFTYLLPLLIPGYNDRYKFLIEDKESYFGIYSKTPKAIHWIFIFVPYVILMTLVSISFYRAAKTSPGSISYSEEWDLKMSSETIKGLDYYAQKGTSQERLGLSTYSYSSLLQLKKMNEEKYFELSESGFEDVKIKSLHPSLPQNTIFTRALGFKFSKQILWGVEENCALKHHKKYLLRLKENKMSEAENPRMYKVSNEDEKVSYQFNRDAFGILSNSQAANEGDQNCLDLNETLKLSTMNYKTLKPLFSVFRKTFENRKGGGERIWIKWLKKKCDRWHHCSICNTWVLMMDHHCPWINNWIGYFNYKYFFLLIMYCMISTIMVNITYWETFETVMAKDEVSNFWLVVITLTYLLSIFMGCVLFFFFLFHVRLLFTNYTTLEYWEKKREKESTWQVSPFETGSYIGNMETKLGTIFNSPNFILHLIELLIPTAPRLQGNGTTFTVTNELSSDLMIDEEDLIYDENKIK